MNRLRLCSVIVWEYQYWVFPSLSVHKRATSAVNILFSHSRKKEDGPKERPSLPTFFFFIREKKSFLETTLLESSPSISFVWTALSAQPWTMTGKRKIIFSWLVYTNYCDHYVSLRAGPNCSLSKIMIRLKRNRVSFRTNKKQILLLWSELRDGPYQNINILVNASSSWVISFYCKRMNQKIQFTEVICSFW